VKDVIVAPATFAAANMDAIAIRSVFDRSGEEQGGIEVATARPLPTSYVCRARSP
jgi:hypothetical protein